MCEQDTVVVTDVDANGTGCLYFMCAGEEELDCGWESEWVNGLYPTTEGLATIGFAEFEYYVSLHRS